MKKTILIALAAVAALAAANCRSIDKTTIGGKPAIVSTQVAPVIFGAIGATAEQCLDALVAEGVTEVKSVNGVNENTTILSRLSGSEACQATGVK